MRTRSVIARGRCRCVSPGGITIPSPAWNRTTSWSNSISSVPSSTQPEWPVTHQSGCDADASISTRRSPAAPFVRRLNRTPTAVDSQPSRSSNRNRYKSVAYCCGRTNSAGFFSSSSKRWISWLSAIHSYSRSRSPGRSERNDGAVFQVLVKTLGSSMNTLYVMVS